MISTTIASAPQTWSQRACRAGSQEPHPWSHFEKGRILLLSGIALRIVVFLFLAPLNGDPAHLDVLDYMVQYHALPPVTENYQSYQPPLYYLLAAPVYGITGSAKCAQLLSLAFSILTLLIVYRLLYAKRLIADEQARQYAFIFACALPQFVQFGLYLSNDSLAICLGALLILQVVRYAASRSLRDLALLGLVTSLGLLTKATFLTFLPVLFFLVLWVGLRRGDSRQRAWATAFAILVLSAGLGSYQFIRSYRETGRPFFSNLDPSDPWSVKQAESYRGPSSFLDFNFSKLLRSPVLSSQTDGAYPLLLFGTFWYQHIPESNFVAGKVLLGRLASTMYLLGLIPTALFLYGLFRMLKDLPLYLSGVPPPQNKLIPRDPRPADEESRTPEQPSTLDDSLVVARYAAVFFLLLNFALLLTVTAKYHVWSIMQARLLFPSFTGGLVAFGAGAEALTRHKAAAAVLKATMTALVICFAFYLSAKSPGNSWLLARASGYIIFW